MIREFWDELPRLVRDIDENARARVIVISSAGPHFTSGIDVGMFAETPPPDAEAARRHRDQYGADFYAVVQRMQDSFTALGAAEFRSSPRSRAAASAVAWIWRLPAMRYATADAFFTIFETNIGMTADVGTFPRIVKLLPRASCELAYTGRHGRGRSARGRFGQCRLSGPGDDARRGHEDGAGDRVEVTHGGLRLQAHDHLCA
ncbi:MAG: hypothetical protein R3E48_13920 [Burkholderiaceae bacterium]